MTADDPQNKRSWSGIKYYMAQALQKHCGDVYYVGPITSSQRYAGRILHEISRRTLKKTFAFHHSLLVAKKDAKIAARRLAGRHFDVIIAPAGATQIAYLKTSIPIMIVKDATFGLLHNYYPQYSNLLSRSVCEGNIIEDLAYKKAQMLVFASEWAARSAIEDYAVEPEKVHVVPMGANLESSPTKEVALRRAKAERCRLLFVGIDWQRKGGAIAFETLLKLEEMGVPAELVICGCTPPQHVTHPHMKVIPFLDKNDPAQSQALERLYREADFFLLPTRSECYGIVFCEANAFGLPVIATETGGVSEIIRHGDNGFLLPPTARGADYARLIAEVSQDDARYAGLVQASRAAFETRLNWDAWGMAIKRIVLAAVSRGYVPAIRPIPDSSTHIFADGT